MTSIVSKLAVTGALLTGLAALAPTAANAASFFTPHAQLVQEINNTYGTQFKVPGHQVADAHAQHAKG